MAYTPIGSNHSLPKMEGTPMHRRRNSTSKAMLARIEDLVTKNVQLQQELKQEQIKNQHFWNHIIWLRFYGDESVGAGPCPFCGSHHLGLRDNEDLSKWSVVCECGALGPTCNSELDAIEAWNKAAKPA